MYRKKGIRFSVEKQQRWRAQGRGMGAGAEYQPWHQVRRGDPASLGRSHLILIDEFSRQMHLLSDAERLALMCVWRLAGITQIREQYPLSQSYEWVKDEAPDNPLGGRLLPGTATVAALLNIRHPKVQSEKGAKSGLWQMTTDLLVDIYDSNMGPEKIAISVKRETRTTARTNEKIKIEKQYWKVRNARFYKYNFSNLCKAQIVSIQSMDSYVLPGPALPSQILDQTAEALAQEHPYKIKHALNCIAETLSTTDLLRCQCALWQAVWTGRYPVALDGSITRGNLVRVDIDTWCDWDPLKGDFQWR